MLEKNRYTVECITDDCDAKDINGLNDAAAAAIAAAAAAADDDEEEEMTSPWRGSRLTSLSIHE